MVKEHIDTNRNILLCEKIHNSETFVYNEEQEEHITMIKLKFLFYILSWSLFFISKSFIF